MTFFLFLMACFLLLCGLLGDEYAAISGDVFLVGGLLSSKIDRLIEMQRGDGE